MIYSASRTFARTLPKAAGIPARTGVAFERKFIRALTSSSGLPKGLVIEHGPWFEYRQSNDPEPHVCSPDFLINDTDFGYTIVGEIKLTWVPEAFLKLKNLYCPVVAQALGGPTRPLVIVRNLAPDSPRPQPSLSFAFTAIDPLYQWLGHEPLCW